MLWPVWRDDCSSTTQRVEYGQEHDKKMSQKMSKTHGDTMIHTVDFTQYFAREVSLQSQFCMRHTFLHTNQ